MKKFIIMETLYRLLSFWHKVILSSLRYKCNNFLSLLTQAVKSSERKNHILF